MIECLSAAPCDGDRVGTCYAASLIDFTPSALGTSTVALCEENWSYDCFTSGPCDFYALLSDEALTAVAPCFEGICKVGGACVDDQYWGPDGEGICVY